MGLGLRARVWTSLRYLAPEISGFLDYISEEEEDHQQLFTSLKLVGHPSLFYGIVEDLVPRNAVLYGPMAICNSNERVNGIYNRIVVQFENFHPNGRECRWRLSYSWGNDRRIENRGNADEMEIKTNYYLVELNAVEGEDLFHDEVDYSRAQPRFLFSENSAVSFPHRVIMGTQNQLYEPGKISVLPLDCSRVMS